VLGGSQTNSPLSDESSASVDISWVAVHANRRFKFVSLERGNQMGEQNADARTHAQKYNNTHADTKSMTAAQ
jgi:hypothetical protein